MIKRASWVKKIQSLDSFDDELHHRFHTNSSQTTLKIEEQQYSQLMLRDQYCFNYKIITVSWERKDTNQNHLWSQKKKILTKYFQQNLASKKKRLEAMTWNLPQQLKSVSIQKDINQS